jgi:hypothetical protein
MELFLKLSPPVSRNVEVVSEAVEEIGHHPGEGIERSVFTSSSREGTAMAEIAQAPRGRPEVQ